VIPFWCPLLVELSEEKLMGIKGATPFYQSSEYAR